jgi:protein-S-isoprenylcysteine O-methyltransferase Ste14
MAAQRRIPSGGAIVIMLFVVIVIPFLPLLVSRRWDWWEAWVYALISVVGFAASRLLAARRHPDILAERAGFMSHVDAQSWDKALAPLTAFGSGFIPLVAGLEASSGQSPDFSIAAELISLAILLAGFVVSSYGMIENRFFSGVVRIQIDRGHHVVSTGPYRWIRHPGYAGAILVYLTTPVFLDSYWAFVPAFVVTAVLVVRTRLEDETLQRLLDDYGAYAARVRFRLLPGVW